MVRDRKLMIFRSAGLRVRLGLGLGVGVGVLRVGLGAGVGLASASASAFSASASGFSGSASASASASASNSSSPMAGKTHSSLSASLTDDRHSDDFSEALDTSFKSYRQRPWSSGGGISHFHSSRTFRDPG